MSGVNIFSATFSGGSEGSMHGQDSGNLPADAEVS